MIQQFIPDSETGQPEFQDKCIFSYDSIFSKDFCFFSMHDTTQGEVKERNRPGGMNFRTMGQLEIVYLHSYWEVYFRKEYAAAKGVKLSEIQHDFWNDLGILRNIILHHGGVAHSKIRECKLIKCFKKGDKIEISPEFMRVIFMSALAFRNEVYSESFPKTYIKIP
jgi:hypothetical protein